MLDHVSIAVADIARSIAFYEQALAPLGITRLMAYGGSDDLPDHVGFGSERKPYLWLGKGDLIGGYVLSPLLHPIVELSMRSIVRPWPLAERTTDAPACARIIIPAIMAPSFSIPMGAIWKLSIIRSSDAANPETHFPVHHPFGSPGYRTIRFAPRRERQPAAMSGR